LFKKASIFLNKTQNKNTIKKAERKFMKKFLIVFAVLFVVCAAALTATSATETKENTNLQAAFENDPPNSYRVYENGVLYLVIYIYDSHGSPIEIVRTPIRD